MAAARGLGYVADHHRDEARAHLTAAATSESNPRVVAVVEDVLSRLDG